MEAYTKKHAVLCKLLTVLLSISTLSVYSYSAPTNGNDAPHSKSFDPNAFYSCLENHHYTQAASVGDSIFQQMEQAYDGVEAFSVIRRKLTVAASLAQQMEDSLEKQRHAQIRNALDLFNHKNKRRKTSLPSVPPAKALYEQHYTLFSEPVTVGPLDTEAQDFLKQYYDLKLMLNTNAIANAGRSLAIIDPGFAGMHNYLLVLPLLHAVENTPLPVRMLPEWIRQPQQLERLSDSCLLHFDLPFQAMTFSKQSALITGKAFSELTFYRLAAEKCLRKRPRTTVECLHRAIDAVQAEDVNQVMTLRLELMQKCLDIGNHALAAMQARKLLETAQNDEKYSEFMWLYIYSLAQDKNIDRILSDIDSVIADTRCETYKAQLLYTKWWALRHKPEESARTAAVEHKILHQYADHPLAAQIMLYHAENFLSKHDPDAAYQLLTDILSRFPSTNAAAKAERILTETKNKTN